MDWLTIHQHRRPEWALRFKVEPRDLWVGIFWQVAEGDRYRYVYLCLLPCLPLRLEWPPRELRHG